MSETDPIVLISYTHDSKKHKDRVLNLANKLRDYGVDCNIDQYEDSPPEGWVRWMSNQIDQSDFVLVICTEIYECRFLGREELGKGFGVQWEGFVITQELYEQAARNTKFIPIIFSEEEAQFIPIILRSSTHYRVDVEEGFEDLYRRLTAQPRIIKPPLGKRRVLSPTPITQSESRENIVGSENVKMFEEELKNQAELSPITKKQDNLNLVLLYIARSKYIFIPSRRVEMSEKWILQLSPDNSRQSAFISNLHHQQQRQVFGLAFKDIASQVRLVKATNIQEESNGYWQVILEPLQEKLGSSALSDFTFNSYTPEDIVELRAKIILLNEQPETKGRRGGYDDGFIESFVIQSEGLIQNIESPLPFLYQQFRDDIPYFLESARLMCVLYLQLTGIVEHIFTLNLEMKSRTEVIIEFEGQRAPSYSNAEPHIIKFEGICNLTESKK